MKNVALIGAGGAVGKEILSVLKDRDFPVASESLHLYGSERSAGTKTETPFGEKEIKLFSAEEAKKADIVFLAVSGDFSKEFAPIIAEGKAFVIDNSSAFRYQDDIPLIVPEINKDKSKGAKLIANPNCTTAILAVALWPLHKEFSVKKCIVSTYQATSGGGAKAMKELEEQTKNYLEGKEVINKRFQHPIPYNIIPHIDTFQNNGYTREEMKVAWETQKIFDKPDLKISCTAVRIPTFRAHAESVTIETEKEITPEFAREALKKAPGVEIVDDPAQNIYPMPLTATKKFNVEVGRIRQNLIYGKNGLDFFVCGDQLLKGAALNAVQIAELL